MTTTAPSRVAGPGPVPPADEAAARRVARLVLGPFGEARTWRSLVHVLLDPVVGIVAFIGLNALLGILAALACTIVAIPVLMWLTLLGSDGFARAERLRYRFLLDVEIVPPEPFAGAEWWERARQRVGRLSSWKELAYAAVLFPLGLFGFTATMTVFGFALSIALMPTWAHGVPSDRVNLGPVLIEPGWQTWAVTPVGLALLLVLPWMVRGWAALDTFLAQNLLGRGSNAALEERVGELAVARTTALTDAEQERRRIERDLHDGAQQTLIALGLHLGMARDRLDTDPAGARALLDTAHAEAKRALDELRDLARGIHPVELGERGLEGALPVLAGRCPVPTTVRVHLPVRPPVVVEGIVYFIVSETLTNVAKHAGARSASVTVTGGPSSVDVEVRDDGRGGADPTGSGLRGLADRVRSVDGTFVVDSPAGGPTVIRAELPCAS